MGAVVSSRSRRSSGGDSPVRPVGNQSNSTDQRRTDIVILRNTPPKTTEASLPTTSDQSAVEAGPSAQTRLQAKEGKESKAEVPFVTGSKVRKSKQIPSSTPAESSSQKSAATTATKPAKLDVQKGKPSKLEVGKSGKAQPTGTRGIRMHERREMITTTETQDLKRIFMGMFENEAPSIHDIYVPTAKALSNDSHDDGSDEDEKMDSEDDYDYVDNMYSPSSKADEISSHYLHSENHDCQSNDVTDDEHHDNEMVSNPPSLVKSDEIPKQTITMKIIQEMDEKSKKALMNDFSSASFGQPIQEIENFISTHVIPNLLNPFNSTDHSQFGDDGLTNDFFENVSPLILRFLESSRNAIRSSLGIEMEAPKQTHSVFFTGNGFQTIGAAISKALSLSQSFDRPIRKPDQLTLKKRNVILMDTSDSSHLSRAFSKADFDVVRLTVSQDAEHMEENLSTQLSNYTDRTVRIFVTTVYSNWNGQLFNLGKLQRVCYNHGALLCVNLCCVNTPVSPEIFLSESALGSDRIQADIYLLTPAYFLGGVGASSVVVMRNTMIGLSNKPDTSVYFQPLLSALEGSSSQPSASQQSQPRTTPARKIQSQLEGDSLNIESCIRAGLATFYQIISSNDIDVYEIFLHPIISEQVHMMKKATCEHVYSARYVDSLVKTLRDSCADCPLIQWIADHPPRSLRNALSFNVIDSSQEPNEAGPDVIPPDLVVAALEREHGIRLKHRRLRHPHELVHPQLKGGWCQALVRSFHTTQDMASLAATIRQLAQHSADLRLLYRFDFKQGWIST